MASHPHGLSRSAAGRPLSALTRLLALWVALSAASVSGLAQVAWGNPSPHTQRLVAVGPAARLEVLDWGGAGRTLVLLAQLGQTAHIYDDWAPLLARSYRVVGITRRGYGESSATGVFSAEELATDIIRVLDTREASGPCARGQSVRG